MQSPGLLENHQILVLQRSTPRPITSGELADFLIDLGPILGVQKEWVHGAAPPKIQGEKKAPKIIKMWIDFLIMWIDFLTPKRTKNDPK